MFVTPRRLPRPYDTLSRSPAIHAPASSGPPDDRRSTWDESSIRPLPWPPRPRSRQSRRSDRCAQARTSSAPAGWPPWRATRRASSLGQHRRPPSRGERSDGTRARAFRSLPRRARRITSETRRQWRATRPDLSKPTSLHLRQIAIVGDIAVAHVRAGAVEEHAKVALGDPECLGDLLAGLFVQDAEEHDLPLEACLAQDAPSL